MNTQWILLRTADNVVQNVIEWDGVSPYDTPSGITLMNGTGLIVGPGFTYNPVTGQFTAPPVPNIDP